MAKPYLTHCSVMLAATALLLFPACENSSVNRIERHRRPQTPRDLDDKEGDYEKYARPAVLKDSFPVFDNPMMADAGETTIEDPEYVIGVECDGVAKAYPISVMGHHELGNDVCGKTPIAVSW